MGMHEVTLDSGPVSEQGPAGPECEARQIKFCLRLGIGLFHSSGQALSPPPVM